MQTITTTGLDIAESAFQIYGVDATGDVVIRRQLKRRHVLAFLEKLPPCLVGIEACGSSHYWSREFQVHGHTVRLTLPAYVKPYVKRRRVQLAEFVALSRGVRGARNFCMLLRTQKTNGCQRLLARALPRSVLSCSA